jgi:type I restriction enzyme S subunit
VIEEQDLYPLPNEWVWTILGDISSQPQYGWTTKAIESGSLHLLRTTDITSGQIDWKNIPYCQEPPPNKEKYLLNDGDIVISRAGSVGYSSHIKNPPESVFASYLIRFKPLIDGNFLSYFLKSPFYWQSIREKSIGIALANVNASKLIQIHVPLPPLPEQHRIVTKIEELFTQLDAGVASLKKVQVQVKHYRQAVLKAAFEGRLTQEWREQHREGIEPADATTLPPLPKGWDWTTFSSVGDWAGGGTPSTNIDEYWGGQILWISSKDVKVLKIFNTELKITSLGVANSAAKMIPAGSLLFVVRSGILQRTLPVALTMVDATVNQDIKVLIPSKKVNNEFLLWIAVAFGDNIRHTCAKDGTTVQSINVPALRQFLIPLAPRHEQDEIVEKIERRMSIADKIENTIITSLREAETLRQSILKRAFEGKLVPQDPTDEPASVLLERIKAEKAHHAAEEKKSKQIQIKSPKRKVRNAN